MIEIANLKVGDVFTNENTVNDIIVLSKEQTKGSKRNVIHVGKKLQKEILESNQNIKILISYGEQWFPWYIRRIAENPKNLFLLLK